MLTSLRERIGHLTGDTARGTSTSGRSTSLRERVGQLTGDGGPIAAVRQKVQGLVGQERVETLDTGDVITFRAANEHARHGMEELDRAEARAEATAPAPGSGV